MDNRKHKTTQQVLLFTDTSRLHLVSQQSRRANLTLASAAQASSKWMEVKFGHQATQTNTTFTKKWFTTRIRRHQSRPGTGFGTAPGLPISSCWRPVDKTWVFLSATFLQNQLPTTDLTFCSEVGSALKLSPSHEKGRYMKCLPLIENSVCPTVAGLPPCKMLQNHRLQVARFWIFTLFVPLSAALRQLPRFHPACNTVESLARKQASENRTETETCVAFRCFRKKISKKTVAFSLYLGIRGEIIIQTF